MTEFDLYILTKRKERLLRLIAIQFKLPKSERIDVNDLHNRVNIIKDWLKEPVIKKTAEPILSDTSVDKHFTMEKLFPSDRFTISNTKFNTFLGNINF